MPDLLPENITATRRASRTAEQWSTPFARERVYAVMAGLLASQPDIDLSEHQLVRAMATKRSSVRSALTWLAADRLVSRKVRTGTHAVRPAWAMSDAPVSLQVGDESFAARNPEMTSRIISCIQAPVPSLVGRRLGLAQGEQVLLIDKLWTRNEQPFMLGFHWIPLDLTSPDTHIEEATLVEAGQDPFQFALRRRNARGGEITNTMSTCHANGGLAELLDVDEGASLWMHEELVADETGRTSVLSQNIFIPGQVTVSFSQQLKPR